ncbi:MAG: FAD-dependent oxidoreductase [Acetobacteraceae bacterium]|nr:FAD-dependent oxidoreductase [Acetobacteraceae bacterium]
MAAPVVIVGAGPAGLACAGRLAAHGVETVVIDDNRQPGGQYFRQLPGTFRVAASAPLARDQARAEALIAALDSKLVTYWPETTVWAGPDKSALAYAGPRGSGRMAARAIVVAAGAYDRPLPFHGWTLPGVITAGGCLNLIKGQGMIPGGRIGLVGNGPLLLVVAYTLLRAGARVVMIAEAARLARLLRALPALASAPNLLWKGMTYREAIRRARVPLLHGHVAVAAEGGQRIESVTVAPVAADGTPRSGGRRRFELDTLVTGYGLAPSNELTRLLGCRHVFAPQEGGWVPVRDDDFATSVPGVYAIGDCAGIGGAEIALLEGAALADRLASRPTGSIRARLRRYDLFRRALSAAYATAGPLWPADAETIVCRCEELTLSGLQEAASASPPDLSAFKSMTRVGMGRCQGRNCLHSAAYILAAAHGLKPGALELPRSRAPARPVPIADLMEETLGPAREPDTVDRIFQS